MGTLQGATILVTGATDGLGRGLAQALAEAGARVLVHGRDPQRVEATVAELSEAAGPAPRGHVADLADLSRVRGLAEEVLAASDRLDVLVNNAGLGAGPSGGRRRETSADGNELRFQVNHLAAFALSRLLLQRLRRSAPARIVNVASGAQQAIDLDDVMLERDYDGWRAYCQSKLAMVADTFTLAEQLDPGEVTVNALHPASLMDTKIVRESFASAPTPVSQGVDAVWRLVADPELAGVTGRYFNGRAESRAAAQAYDRAARAELSRRSAWLTGVDEPVGPPAAAGPH